MPWVAAAGAVVGGIVSAKGASSAAKKGKAGQMAAVAEQKRQFDITQEQNKPWLDAGKAALGRYEDRLGQQGQYEEKIRSNIPQAFQSQTNIPQAYQGQSGNYFGNIQNNVQQGFQFGRQEFDQYKDPGYDFRREEGLRALERGNASRGRRNSGYNTRSLMELGQRAARGRAFQDYQSGVNRENQVYGRGVQDFSRRVGRESELYGRGRQQRQDETGREQELYQRGLRDYGLGVQREEAQYGRDLEQYNRTYVDPMAREAGLANVGQTTAANLGQRRGEMAQNVGGNLANAGSYGASGTLGQYGAISGAVGALGNAYKDFQSQQASSSMYYDTPYGKQVQGDAYLPAAIAPQ